MPFPLKKDSDKRRRFDEKSFDKTLWAKSTKVGWLFGWFYHISILILFNTEVTYESNCMVFPNGYSDSIT